MLGEEKRPVIDSDIGEALESNQNSHPLPGGCFAFTCVFAQSIFVGFQQKLYGFTRIFACLSTLVYQPSKSCCGRQPGD